MSFKTPALPTSLPTEPYIVTTPSEWPFNIPDWQCDNWRIPGWFERNENHLQYQTFLWRDPSESLFQLRTAYEMRAGPAEAMRKEKEKQARNAGKLGNGAAVVAKKKISMSDYKKKGSPAVAQRDNNVAEGKVNAIEEEQPAEAKNIDPPGTNKREQPMTGSGESLHTTEALPPTAQSTIVPEVETSHEIKKNKLGEAETLNPLDSRKRRLPELPASTEAQPLPKKLRTTETPVDQEGNVGPENPSEQVRGNTKELKHITQQPASTTAPVKKLGATITKQPLSAPSWRGHGESVQRQPLSLPTPPHHEDSMPKDQHDLPKWCSSSSRPSLLTPPRLSNDFRKVDRLPRGRRSAVPQRAQPTQVISPPPSTSSPDSVRMSVIDSSNSSVGGDPVEEKKPMLPVKGVARKRPAPIGDAASDHIHPVQSSVVGVARPVKPDDSGPKSRPEASTTSVPEDDELLVKFKFSKGFRKDVQRILQLKPSPRPITQNNPTRELPHKDNDITAGRNDKELKHTRRPDDQEIYVPPTKRQKLDLPATTAVPRTPLPTNNTLSPAVLSTPSSSLHRQVLTPKKDKDLTKKSSVSSLFQVSRNKQSTPQKPPPAILTPITNTQSTATTPQSTARPSDGAKWFAEHKRLSNIGRTLKHKMQEVTLSRTSPSTSTSDKHHHLAALHGIESLLAFMLSFVAREHSLALEKRAAFALSTYSSMGPFGKEVSRACAPWPHLSGMVDSLLATCQGVVVKAAGTTGGYPDAAAPADVGRDEKKELERLTTAIRDIQGHAESAAKLLPTDVMSKEYPTAAREAGHVSPFAGLGMQPSAAVKMGVAFLNEYTSKSASKGLGWEAALKFGEASEL